MESKTWFAKYRDGNRLVQIVPTGCRDETAARQILADLERRAEKVRSGILTGAEACVATHQDKPLAAHFDAFDASMEARGISEIHRSYTRRYLDRLANECGFGRLADLNRDALEKWLAGRSAAGVGQRHAMPTAGR